MDHATVRLGDLQVAWEDGDPTWPGRSSDGEAEGAAVVDCPRCLRPSMLALAGSLTGIKGESRWLKLVPVRTASDLILIRGSAS